MKKIHHLFDTLPKPLKNKYIITILIFVIWILFIDTYDIMSQLNMDRQVQQLQEQKEYYQKEIFKDSTALQKLTNDKKEQERFAREKFLMKKNNEDIFIVRKKGHANE